MVVTENSKTVPGDFASVFEQRAEYLSPAELKTWTAQTDRDHAVVAKLLGPGAKLLIGPRGCGKSTLLRTTYFEAIAAREPLAAYINYSNSLALEPLFNRQANALHIFRQWLLAKVISGVHQSFTDMAIEVPERMRALALDASVFIRGFESGGVPQLPNEPLSPQVVTDLIESWCDDHDIRRCVLLMDDAAHAFSPEQQREFFEVFRGLRSRRVAGKAAVYPGITSYSPNFHAGHDAELIEVWNECNDAYLNSMRRVVDKRLPVALREQLTGKEELVDLLALASFGIPRGFLNMLSSAVGIEEASSTRTPTRRKVETAVQEHAASVRALFTSLRAKLPRFLHFVEAGIELESAFHRVLRTYNQRQEVLGEKTNIVAVREPILPKFERVLSMLEYAGVLRLDGRVSRGVKGRFRRYALHNAIVVAENLFVMGKSYSIRALVTSLVTTSAHAFARSNPDALLGKEFELACVLNLPNCRNCGTPRLSEEQRFCMRCGAELGSASLYEELLRAKIEELPLTANRIATIRQHTKIDTVQDILLDDQAQSLRLVPRIGAVWASRIRTLAEEFVSV